MALSLVACGAEKEPADTTVNNGEADAFTFVMGIDPEYPPFSYLGDDGEYAGFDVETCKAACEKLGWEFKVFEVNWDQKLIQLDAGECDCVWAGMTLLPSMKEAGYVLSDPYFDNSQVMMVKEGSDIKTLADLAGKVVGVQMSTSADDMLNDGQAALTATFKELKTYETYTIAFADLKAGGCDAIAIDVTTGNFQMENNPDFPCVYLEEMLGNEQYGVGLRKGETEMAAQISNALKALAADGTVAKIAANYPEIEQYISIEQ